MYQDYNDELYHYGVLGMKWGVRRSSAKANRAGRLQKKALKYDLQSERAYRKSEKIHADQDLGSRNKAARKAANYQIRATKMDKKALKSTDEWKRLGYERKAAKLRYKAGSKQIDANRMSKAVGYGVKAMAYSVKSDKAAKKAAKVRLKIANDNRYIAMTKRKISSVENDPKLSATVAEIRKKYSDLLG